MRPLAALGAASAAVGGAAAAGTPANLDALALVPGVASLSDLRDAEDAHGLATAGRPRHTISMNTARVDQIIQFALLAAGRNDDWKERELGPIHLIKCVYLADVAHAEKHGGATFTDAPWRFHHFGPWAEPVYERLNPSLAAIDAERREIPSKFDKDFIRWRKVDDRAYEDLEKELPHVVAAAVSRCVRCHGSQTGDLLHDVYMTPPMLRAVPGQLLVFDSKPKAQMTPPSAAPTKEQEKRRDERVRTARAEIQRRIEARKAAVSAPSGTWRAPRYDEVFYQGASWLDSLAGGPPPTGQVEVEFDDTVWGSATRGTECD